MAQPVRRPGHETVRGHGVLYAGHQHDPDTVEAEVKAWLADRLAGDPWRRRHAARDIRVTRAWWGGPELGFVGQDHPAAEPVVIAEVDDEHLDVDDPPPAPATDPDPTIPPPPSRGG